MPDLEMFVHAKYRKSYMLFARFYIETNGMLQQREYISYIRLNAIYPWPSTCLLWTKQPQPNVEVFVTTFIKHNTKPINHVISSSGFPQFLLINRLTIFYMETLVIR